MYLDDLMWDLPLFDDLFLSMQGQNVMIVDASLRDWEINLARELFQTESTPVNSMMIVSAFSQMWIFAVYELLRTWRDRVRRLKKEVQKPSTAAARPGEDDIFDLVNLADMYYSDQLERLRTDKSFASELDRAFQKLDLLYRRIESLRMNLAKHEVPKMSGMPAVAPGYARIDPVTGSIQWQVDLGNKRVDIVTRQGLADDLREIVITRFAEDAKSKNSKRKKSSKKRK